MDEVRQDEKPQKINPFDRANVISKVFFCWLLPYFVKGYRRELTEDDMYQHPQKHDSAMLGDKLEAAWLHQVRHKKNPSLIIAMCSVFLSEITILWMFIIMMEAVRFSQPLMISKLLRFYDENSVQENRTETYTYAGLILSISFLNVLLYHTIQLQMVQVGMKMRIACCSLVYRKSLKLNKSALAETTIGQMVNLLSNDVARFDQAIPMMNHLIIGPLETIIVMILLNNSVGYTGVIGGVTLLIFVPIQALIGRKASQYRFKTAVRTDERIRLMNEIISGIQVIKMYAWEKSFAQLAGIARRKEMEYIRLASVLRAILMSSSLVLNRVAVSSCILSFILTGNSLSAAYVFTISSFYRLLATVTMFFPQAISSVSEMITSIARVKTFLLYDEIDSDSSIEVRGIETKSLRKDGHISPLHKITHRGIYVKGASAKWLISAPGKNLEDVTIDVSTGELVAIVGAVGSGKTTLLNLILGELKAESGKVTRKGTVSYASQEPWIFGGSIRQNILFGQTYKQEKYCEVIRVCALERDLTLLPHGDRTLVGERGITLSGGQRARINLARAVYKEADIYLLDDPLSAVDTNVGKQLFEECVSGYLKDKGVILVTHQLQYLKNLNNIYKLENGKVDVSGSYHAISNLDTNFPKIVSFGEDESIRRKSLMEENEEFNGNDDEVQVLQREEKGQGSVTWHVYKSFLSSGGSICGVFFLFLAFVMSQALDSGAEYFVTIWVNIEQWLAENNQLNVTNEVEANGNLTAAVPSLHGNFYEKWSLTSIFTDDLTVIYYSCLVTIIVIISFIRSLAFYRWCLTVSTRLHNKMFDNIVNSPMRFFNVNPSGRILNRFSKDIGVLDETLPMTLLDTIQIGLTVFAISLVIGSLSAWILVPTIMIIMLFYCYRVVFLKTSRDVKRIESITRSPIYTHLTATLQGLTTIRAFKAQKILKKEFDKYQNVNTAASFMYIGVTRTFGFWLDLHCVIYFAMVVVAMLFVKSETFGGNMGLALTQAMKLTGMFQYGMRQWSEMENQMTSVERVQEYVDLEPEKGGEITELPESWPEKGHIKFKNVSLRYAPDDPFVLKDINITIKNTENVGVVGRTGAGKSSLVQALFRLASMEGSIFIDDLDTKTVELKELRSKISIIPQEPVLFSGTLRKNLDPFNKYDDEHLWNALDEVELKTVISHLRLGLDSKMSEGGSNFSVGQRQLVCLARAILRNNKILVLDEATANVDSQTDELIQKTIRKKFVNCTVLTIAHRLHTIMDSDKVLVMDAGQKVEFNHPHLLLQNKDGAFYSLVMQTGSVAAKNLMVIAEKAYLTQEVTRL